MQPDAHEELVERAVLAEDRLPGVDADQVAGPERDDHREQDRPLRPAAGVAHEEVGERQADGQRRRRDERAHDQGLEERPEVRPLE